MSTVNPKKSKCCGTKQKMHCCNLDLKVTVEELPSHLEHLEELPPTRIGYFFNITNSGPSMSNTARLYVLFTGPIEPPTQSGWKIDRNTASYDIGDIEPNKVPIVAVLTFSNAKGSTVIGTIMGQTYDCGLGSNSIIASYDKSQIIDV